MTPSTKRRDVLWGNLPGEDGWRITCSPQNCHSLGDEGTTNEYLEVRPSIFPRLICELSAVL